MWRSVGRVSAKALWQECAWCVGGTARRLSEGERAGEEHREGTQGQILQGLVGHSEDFALTLSEVWATTGF